MSPQPETSRGIRRSWTEHGLLLVLLFAVALGLRAYGSHDQVFVQTEDGEEYVRFRGTDAWYRMRLVENLLAHFPHSIRFDPYLRHPDGDTVLEAPLFDHLLATPAWFAGGGQPSTELVETVAAWIPAILGALVTLPVYFLAHRLWGRPAGLIAAALIAVLPGRFLDRSLLGAADHHVAEVWWSSCCLLFLVLALTRRRTPEDETARRFPVYPAAAGLSLAAYLLTWRSGTALPCLLIGWAAVQLAADARRGRPSGYLAELLVPATATALLAIVPWLDGSRVPYRHAAVLAAMLVASAGLAAFGRWRQKRRPSMRSLAAAAVLGLATAAGAAVLLRAQLVEIVELFRRLAPTAWSTTVAEMRPLHLDDSLIEALWRELTTAAAAAALGLALLLWRSWRHGRPADLLLSVWSLAMLAASLVQRRFTTYLTVVAALLAAAAVTWLLGVVPSRRRGLALAALAAVLWIPNVRAAAVRAARPSGPDPAWHSASLWMRANTPEPFGDPGYYFARYPAPGTSGDRPRAAYGVMAWWDRGFWLLHTARRVPVANPKGHGILTAASFYLEQDPAAGRRLLDEAGARYVVVDGDMPIRQAGAGEIGLGSIASMARWLGRPVERYVERFELRSADGDWRPIFLYHPDYFRTMAVRLQTFAGEAVAPRSSIWVVGFREERRRDGAVVKRITAMKPFDSHRRAAEYLAERPADRHRLVSTDPASSCVPLAALDGFRRVYPEAGPHPPAPVQVFAVGARSAQTISSEDRPENPQAAGYVPSFQEMERPPRRVR
jgi:dolichyl-diphosphooligosaccharide--protein glycosyltransferase